MRYSGSEVIPQSSAAVLALRKTTHHPSRLARLSTASTVDTAPNPDSSSVGPSPRATPRRGGIVLPGESTEGIMFPEPVETGGDNSRGAAVREFRHPTDGPLRGVASPSIIKHNEHPFVPYGLYADEATTPLPAPRGRPPAVTSHNSPYSVGRRLPILTDSTLHAAGGGANSASSSRIRGGGRQQYILTPLNEGKCQLRRHPLVVMTGGHKQTSTDVASASSEDQESTECYQPLLPHEMKTGRKVQYRKTRVCPWYTSGRCMMGDHCNYAHSQSELRVRPDLTRTRMCPKMESCTDPSCRFAHGSEELRATGAFFRTKLCKFWQKGSCPAGVHCRHAHGEEQLRQPDCPDPLASQPQEPVILSRYLASLEHPSVCPTGTTSRTASTSGESPSSTDEALLMEAFTQLLLDQTVAATAPSVAAPTPPPPPPAQAPAATDVRLRDLLNLAVCSQDPELLECSAKLLRVSLALQNKPYNNSTRSTPASPRYQSLLQSLE